MLSIFRTNQLLGGLLLIFYIVLLRSGAFVLEQSWLPTGQGILADYVYEWLGQSGFWASSLAIGLLFFQAFYVNLLVAENRLGSEVNLFPGLFLILVSSVHPDFLYLSPVLMANTFALLALGQLFNVSKQVDSSDHIFNIGFWAGMASLFYASYLLLIIVAFSGLNLLRGFKIKERLMVLIGLLCPYWLLSMYWFWNDQFFQFWQKQFLAQFDFWSFPAGMDLSVWVGLGTFGLFLLVVLLSYRSYLFKKNMQVQRMVLILFWMLMYMGLSVLFQAGIQMDHLLVLGIPLGVFLALSFSKLSPPIAEVLHLLLLAGLLIFQYRDLL